MNGLGQRQNRPCRGFAVVGRQRDIALAIVEKRLACEKALAALLGGSAQGGAGKARLASVDLFLRPRQSAADDVVKVSIGRPAISFS